MNNKNIIKEVKKEDGEYIKKIYKDRWIETHLIQNNKA